MGGINKIPDNLWEIDEAMNGIIDLSLRYFFIKSFIYIVSIRGIFSVDILSFHVEIYIVKMIILD